ncbi:MAG: hypothetical protein FD155_534 [Bacteroidetes bacterium]|nr:MAG: hypothetical protein FD155_534 [Bacteroidota bacterium]
MLNIFPVVVYPGIFKNPILLEDFSNFKYDTELFDSLVDSIMVYPYYFIMSNDLMKQQLPYLRIKSNIRPNYQLQIRIMHCLCSQFHRHLPLCEMRLYHTRLPGLQLQYEHDGDDGYGGV